MAARSLSDVHTRTSSSCYAPPHSQAMWQEAEGGSTGTGRPKRTKWTAGKEWVAWRGSATGEGAAGWAHGDGRRRDLVRFGFCRLRKRMPHRNCEMSVRPIIKKFPYLKNKNKSR